MPKPPDSEGICLRMSLPPSFSLSLIHSLAAWHVFMLPSAPLAPFMKNEEYTPHVTKPGRTPHICQGRCPNSDNGVLLL